MSTRRCVRLSSAVTALVVSYGLVSLLATWSLGWDEAFEKISAMSQWDVVRYSVCLAVLFASTQELAAIAVRGVEAEFLARFAVLSIGALAVSTFMGWFLLFSLGRDALVENLLATRARGAAICLSLSGRGVHAKDCRAADADFTEYLRDYSERQAAAAVFWDPGVVRVRNAADERAIESIYADGTKAVGLVDVWNAQFLCSERCMARLDQATECFDSCLQSWFAAPSIDASDN